MNINQRKIRSLEDITGLSFDFDPDVFLLFVSPGFPRPELAVRELHLAYPSALMLGCSTAGEILGNQVLDDTIALTAVKFENTRIRSTEVDMASQQMDSFRTGERISENLYAEDLRHIFVLSDGLVVNGAELVKGLQAKVPETVSITGGLAGDGSNFEHTFVVHAGGIHTRKIVALGFYGTNLKIGFGSKGGWDSFGIERLVTRSEGNILYELDGKPALELYKSFLGEKANELPGSGLLFPLSMRDTENQSPVVRTILAVDEEKQSLTFAGDIPEGAYVRLMKANIDRIIDGAEQSARISREFDHNSHQLALLISCVGRRLVLKQLAEEEVEAVNEVFDNKIFTTGFYSYGEIAPFGQFAPCSLHNQTMTITTLAEITDA